MFHLYYIILFVLFIAVFPSTSIYTQPLPPANFIATAYDYHIELRWNRSIDPNVNTYRLYRADDTGNFQLLKTLTVNDTLYSDFIGAHDVEYLLFPIPQVEIDLSGGNLLQNQGY